MKKSVSCAIPYGEDCLATFDFDKKLFDSFLMQVPEEKRESTRKSLITYPFREIYDTKEKSYSIAFESEIGNDIIEVDDVFCPLRIVKFIKM